MSEESYPVPRLVHHARDSALEQRAATPGRLHRWGDHLRHNLDLTAGLVIILIVGGLALAAPVIATEDIRAVNIAHRLEPPFWLEQGQLHTWLGTDQLGRDLFSRLVYGARVSLSVALISVAFSASIGITMGVLAGYFGGLGDAVLMRLADIVLALPGIIITIVVLSFLGSDARNIILVLAVTQWVLYARTVRALVLSLKQREFVESARAMGASDVWIILRHLLPNCLTPIGVLASLQVATMILLESSLSFLGLGVQPPTPSWGITIAEGREFLDSAWWISTFPGLLIVITVLGVKFFSDGLSRVLDPRGRER